MRSVVVVPLAGLGSRFPREEYHVCKPMILIDDKSIIEWSMSCIDYENCDLVFIVRQEHINEFAIDSFLKQKFPGAHIVVVPELTRGAAETCLAAKDYINPDAPLAIHCSDVYWEPRISIQNIPSDVDGRILTFKSNSPNYSYSKVDGALVSEVAEKKVISNNASVGLYWFKEGADFVEAAQDAVKNYSGKEIHLAPCYNYLIKKGKQISIQEVDSIGIFGTPEEYKFFVKNSLKSLPANKKTVGVCCDHSGYESKEAFKKLAAKLNLKVVDFGTFSASDCDYSEHVKATCKAILEDKCDFGFGFCRSGQGVNIAANKIPGIRSVLCYNNWAAAVGVKHNCANFFAMAEKFSGPLEIHNALVEVMTNSFQGGRHQTRLMKNEH